MKSFLAEHKAPMAVATDVLKAACAEAEKTGRRLFVHVGAPWCGSCHRLEDFLALPEIAPLFAKDFVDVKIDEDRMVGGKELEAKLRKGRTGGIPWLLFAEPDLTELATSDGPKGNTGYPSEAHEIEHFMAMLDSTRREMTSDDLATIRRVLDERGAAGAAARAKREAAERSKPKSGADKQ